MGAPAARLVVRVGPADVGRRVTLRHRLGDDTATLTDVVGTLESWSAAGELLVRRRDGRTVAVAARDLVAARVVAPEVSAEDMQRIAQTGWPAEESAMLGEWELRWAGGGTGRANSVRVAGTPGRPLDAALTAVTRWYADHGGRARLQVPSPSVHDAALDSAGWPVATRVLLLTADAAELEQRCAHAGTQLSVSISGTPSAAWLATVTDRDTDDDARLVRLLTAPAEVGFASAVDDRGALLGIGRASRGQGWVGVTSVDTRPAARRRGVATAVMGALATWALARDTGRVYLQVFADNQPALALYEHLGFTRHHAYVYRAPQPG